jgi:hypothetical protein
MAKNHSGQVYFSYPSRPARVDTSNLGSNGWVFAAISDRLTAMSFIVRMSLGHLMERLRIAADLSRRDVDRTPIASISTLQRLETGGFMRPPNNLVSALCDLYGVSPAQKAAVLEMARNSLSHGWWENFNSALPSWFSPYVELETEARRLLTFSPLVIPGVLQTAAYSEETLLLDPNITTKQLAQQIEIRERRKAVVLRLEKPLLVVAVLHEIALVDEERPKVMAEQIEHLRDLNRRGHVDARIIPSKKGGLYRAQSGGFNLLEFDLPQQDRDEGGEIVYWEAYEGGRYTLEKSLLASYRENFTEVLSRSISLEEYMSS